MHYAESQEFKLLKLFRETFIDKCRALNVPKLKMRSFAAWLRAQMEEEALFSEVRVQARVEMLQSSSLVDYNIHSNWARMYSRNCGHSVCCVRKLGAPYLLACRVWRYGRRRRGQCLHNMVLEHYVTFLLGKVPSSC